MFYIANKFNQPLNAWDVSAVTNMSGMFNGAIAFSQSLGNWNVSNVTTFVDMFRNTSGLSVANKAKIHSNFKTNTNWTTDWSNHVQASTITDSNFQSAINLWFDKKMEAIATYGHISDWNVSGVTDMSDAFMHRASFNEDLGAWDVSQVLNMSQMFRGAFKFNQSIAHWEISKVSKMTNMFGDGSSLSDANKGLIHSTFSKNKNWPYDWSKFVVQPNSAPTDLNAAGPLAILENQPIGSFVGQFTAKDADANTILTFTLVGGANDNHFFSIDTNGTLTTTTVFDYESNASYQIRVKVRDQFNLWIKQDFTVKVLDIPKEGGKKDDTNSTKDTTIPKLTLSNHTVKANQPKGTIVGEISIEGHDKNHKVEYSLISGKGSKSNDLFYVGPYNNLRTKQSFNFDKDDRNMSVRVFAKGEGNSSIEKKFSIFLLNDEFVDYNRTQPPYGDGNFTHDQNGTKPPLDDHNKTGNQKDTIDNPKKTPFGLPLVRTLDVNQSKGGKFHFAGKILSDGGAEILEVGIEISNNLFFRKSQLVPVELKENRIKLVLNELEPDTRYYFRAYARNDLGVGKGTVKRLRTPSVPSPKTFWSRLEDIGDGWMSSSWFGSFLLQENQWAYHQRLGWIYLPVEQKNGIWLWRDKGEWLWTSKESWPYLWKNKSGSWLYLFPSRPGRDPIFYDYGYSKYRK